MDKGLNEGYDIETLKLFEKQLEEKRRQESYANFMAEYNARYGEKEVALVEVGEIEVGTKTISETDFKQKAKKAIEIAGYIAIAGFGMVMIVDLLMHPENYFTTFAEFEGSATFMEIVKRFPENIVQMTEIIGGKLK